MRIAQNADLKAEVCSGEILKLLGSGPNVSKLLFRVSAHALVKILKLKFRRDFEAEV